MDCSTYILLPPLQQIAIVKLATSLWAENDIRTLISNRKRKRMKKGEKDEVSPWQEVEDIIIERVKAITCLTATMRQNLLYAVNGVGVQITSWWEYHSKRNHLVTELPKAFCWTPQGTIDMKRTAEVLLRDQRLRIETRYKLCCIFCFEDKVIELFNKLPRTFLKNRCGEKLIDFWTFRLRGTVNDLINDMTERNFTSPNAYAFWCATKSGNLAATRYFIEKLNPVEMEQLLVSCASEFSDGGGSKDFPLEFRNDVVFYLLSRMSKTQQLDTFNRTPFNTLVRSLDWPWQNLFIKIVIQFWPLFSEFLYQMLAAEIARKMEKGPKDYNYGQLFVEFWALSTKAVKFRSSTIDHYSWHWSSIFVRSGELECFTLILKEMPAHKKSELIFNFVGLNMCEQLILRDKWVWLKYFVTSCLPTEQQLMEFRAVVSRNEKLNQSRFCDILDRFIEDKNKA